MDSDAFRRTYRDLNERYCVFEKAMLTNQCGCSQAQKFCIAEREGVHCGADEAQADCIALLNLLRQQARFALKSRHPTRALPHAQALRLQVGGLRGVAAVVEPTEPAPANIADVRGLIIAALAHFGALEHLPFAQIMQQIAAYRGRRRRSRLRD
ncbi:hypothetical protein CKO25_15245 [Thiocapsa imhoffii]|uniref:Uncharacterized protein n=1 Tax=Thiocapsa imhoffii TaxID=382777 RepID=A0A9X1B9H9_9GAMM|nr:hypothetical protein [Thiocapsa imhoffii]MBK1645979.1 hypothetical protein [Thiocapsa imhoffii]